jgi:hypothetical protein
MGFTMEVSKGEMGQIKIPKIFINCPTRMVLRTFLKAPDFKKK